MEKPFFDSGYLTVKTQLNGVAGHTHYFQHGVSKGHLRPNKFVVAAVTGALLAISLFTAPRASATVKNATLPPTCRPAQLRPSMSPPQGTYSAADGFKATLWFQNTGATCRLIVDNVPIQGVSGPSNTPVSVGSVSGAVAYPPIVLANGDRAYASVSIGSISTEAFKKLVREHGSSCDPKYADGIEVESNPAVRDDSWPSHYFALPEQVPICTKDYFNVAAGVIQKLLTPAQARQVAYEHAANELQDYLNYWHLVGPSTASKLFLVPSQRDSTVKLASGKVLSYHPYSWKSQSDFTLLMSLDLHFNGWHGAWNVGKNDRFVTFTRASNGQQLMALNTGP
jgi:hypothetical protein